MKVETVEIFGTSAHTLRLCGGMSKMLTLPEAASFLQRRLQQRYGRGVVVKFTEVGRWPNRSPNPVLRSIAPKQHELPIVTVNGEVICRGNFAQGRVIAELERRLRPKGTGGNYHLPQE